MINGSVKISDLTAALRGTLLGISEIKQIQKEGVGKTGVMGESVSETPLIQIYFETRTTSEGSGTDRITFGGNSVKPIRKNLFVFNLDVYARQRSNIGEDLKAAYDITDLISDELDKQDDSPYFGNKAIKSFSWTVDRVIFEYAKYDYVGVRFVISLNVF